MGTRKLAIVIPGRIVVLSERVRFLTRRVELVVAQARWKARVNDKVQRSTSTGRSSDRCGYPIEPFEGKRWHETFMTLLVWKRSIVG